MGLLEVVPRLVGSSAAAWPRPWPTSARSPDVVVTIDSPGFTLRLLRAVAPLGVRGRTMSPRKPGLGAPGGAALAGSVGPAALPAAVRARLLRQPWPARHFRRPSRCWRAAPIKATRHGFGTAHALPPDRATCHVMPGSRRSEVARLLPVLGAALQRLPAAVPGLSGVAARRDRSPNRRASARCTGPVRPLLLADGRTNTTLLPPRRLP